MNTQSIGITSNPKSSEFYSRTKSIFSSMPSIVNACAKRAMDILFATGGILITGPLLPFVALAIKLDSKGPVFFLQERVGKDGKTFWIHKLRTMHLPENRVSANKQDGHNTRITRVGGVLRKFSIDELPQLIDILLGYMSIIGPRPRIASEFSSTSDEDRGRILATRPGLAAPGSLNVRRSNYSELSKGQELNDLDANYAETYTVLGDLIVFLKTLLFIHRGR